MKKNTIFLEAAKDENRLKIAIYEANDVIWRYEEKDISIDEINIQCRQMMEYMNEIIRKGDRDPDASDKLKAKSTALYGKLLPWNIKEKLLKSDAHYLVLRIDDHLVQIPWELICINGEFLCQRFNMGRLVKTRQPVEKFYDRKRRKDALSMWILANPEGDLDDAESEGYMIFEDMGQIHVKGKPIVAPRFNSKSEISSQKIKEKIMNYDFVHFAGHVDYNFEYPSQSGWKLSDDKFTVTDIDDIKGGMAMPFLIFSNACQSARTEEWKWDDNTGAGSSGVANAFLRAGVKHYIGTSWEVSDKPSSYFASDFYNHLTSGKTVGEAIKEARTGLIHKYPVCVLSYVLYGDPRKRYFVRNGNHKKELKNDSPVIKESKSKLTRGTMSDYSLNPELLRIIPGWLIFLLLICVLAYGVTIAERIWKAEQQDKIRTILFDRAEKQRERASQLYEDLMEIVKSLPPSDQKISDDLTMAVVFDPQIIKKGKEKMILFAIIDQISESNIPIKLLYRESFDILLEELIRKIRSAPPEERKRPKLLMPKLLLILEVYETSSESVVLMQLIENETSQVLTTQFEELDNGKKVLEQKKELAHNLLAKISNILKNQDYSDEMTKE